MVSVFRPPWGSWTLPCVSRQTDLSLDRTPCLSTTGCPSRVPTTKDWDDRREGGQRSDLRGNRFMLIFGHLSPSSRRVRTTVSRVEGGGLSPSSKRLFSLSRKVFPVNPGVCQTKDTVDVGVGPGRGGVSDINLFCKTVSGTYFSTPTRCVSVTDTGVPKRSVTKKS